MSYRTLSAAAVAVVLGLTSAACGDGARLDGPVAGTLAERAERIAGLLDAGRPCEARAAGEELVELTSTGVEDGSVPEPVAEEIIATTASITEEIACPVPGGAATVPDEDGEDDADEHENGEDGEDDADEHENGEDGEDDEDEDADDDGPGRGRKLGRDRGRGGEK